jgi:hypothetical protein
MKLMRKSHQTHAKEHVPKDQMRFNQNKQEPNTRNKENHMHRIQKEINKHIQDKRPKDKPYQNKRNKHPLKETFEMEKIHVPRQELIQEIKPVQMEMQNMPRLSKADDDPKEKLKVFCSFESEEMEDDMNSCERKGLQEDIENIVFANKRSSKNQSEIESKTSSQKEEVQEKNYSHFPNYSHLKKDPNNKKTQKRREKNKLVQSINLKSSSTSLKRKQKTRSKQKRGNSFSEKPSNNFLRESSSVKQTMYQTKSHTRKQKRRKSSHRKSQKDIILRNIQGIGQIKANKQRMLRRSLQLKESNDKYPDSRPNDKRMSQRRRAGMDAVANNKCSIALTEENERVHRDLRFSKLNKDDSFKEKFLLTQESNNNKIRGFSTSKRLYQMSKERHAKNKEKTKQNRRAKLMKELESCTFTPAINPASMKYLQRRRNSQLKKSKSKVTIGEEVMNDTLKTDRKLTRKRRSGDKTPSKFVQVFLKKKMKSKKGTKDRGLKVRKKSKESGLELIQGASVFHKNLNLPHSSSGGFKKSEFFKKIVDSQKYNKPLFKNCKQLIEHQLSIRNQSGFTNNPTFYTKKQSNWKKADVIPLTQNLLVTQNQQCPKPESFSLTERMSEILGFQPTMLGNSLLTSQFKDKRFLLKDGLKLSKLSKEQSKVDMEDVGGTHHKHKYVENKEDSKIDDDIMKIKTKREKNKGKSLVSASHNKTLLKTCENHKGIIEAYIARLEKCSKV